MGAVHGYLMVPVNNCIKDVEGQPADGEGHHDREEHGVNALGLVAAVLVLPHSLHHALPLP